MDWGVLINFRKKVSKRRSVNPAQEEVTEYSADVLLNLAKNIEPKSDKIYPPNDGERGEMKLVTISLKNITQVSSARIFVPQDLTTYDNRQSVLKSLSEIKRRLNGVPLLDPIEDMKIKDKDFKTLIKRIELCEKKLHEFKGIDSHYCSLYEKKMKIGEEIKKVKSELKKAHSLLQMDELKSRKRVLRRLGYCTPADVIEIKGRVACEITR